MFTKVKQAWRVLRGKVYTPSSSKVIYVALSGKAENQFVQLLSWRDTVLALDAQGKIWGLNQDYDLGSGFVVQLLQESPRRY